VPDGGAPSPVLAVSSPSVVLANGGAPAVLADAPLSVMLADGLLLRKCSAPPPPCPQWPCLPWRRAAPSDPQTPPVPAAGPCASRAWTSPGSWSRGRSARRARRDAEPWRSVERRRRRRAFCDAAARSHRRLLSTIWSCYRPKELFGSKMVHAGASEVKNHPI
jgi:ribosomal protein L37AE/L43A